MQVNNVWVKKDVLIISLWSIMCLKKGKIKHGLFLRSWG